MLPLGLARQLVVSFSGHMKVFDHHHLRNQVRLSPAASRCIEVWIANFAQSCACEEGFPTGVNTWGYSLHIWLYPGDSSMELTKYIVSDEVSYHYFVEKTIDHYLHYEKVRAHAVFRNDVVHQTDLSSYTDWYPSDPEYGYSSAESSDWETISDDDNDCEAAGL